MVNGITWQEETQARLTEARSRQKQAKTEVNRWEEYADALERVLGLDKERHSINPNGHDTFDRENLRKQSTWKNLCDIMSSNNGLLVVVDAVTILVEAKVFADREHARNVIYSTLNSHKRDVQRMREGVYRLRKQGERVPKQKGTGLKQVVLELKTVNPDMSKKDIKQTLVKRGFDFKGKSPGRAVHLVWITLGYAKKEKEGKQQSLLE